MNTLAQPAGPNPGVVNPWHVNAVRIEEIQPETPGVATYHLRIQDEPTRRRYQFEPGQFNMLYLPGAGEIAISISGPPTATETLAHTVRVAGNVTRTLASLSPGATLGVRGPFGSSWPISQCIGRDVLVVTGGIGLAPLRPAILSFLQNRKQFGHLNLLYGARSPQDLLYSSEYADWARQGMIVQTTVDRSAPGWTGHVGVVTLLLERLRTFDPRRAVLLCCGPEVMMRFSVRAALQRGLAPDRIWLALERNMQCAVGLCGHCQLGPEFVCRDGPVFRYDRIAHLIDVEGL